MAYNAAVITVSDRSATGEREDVSGGVVCKTLTGQGFVITSRHTVPDEQEHIENLLKKLCDNDCVPLVVTTGGTGFSPRDVTPEATLAVVEKLCPGIPEAMRSLSLAVSRRAMLSRAVAGIRGNTLIVNLPGSPKAVGECLGFILSELHHGIAILRGDSAECGKTVPGKMIMTNAANKPGNPPGMKSIPVKESVGTVLCHDITRIVPGEFKGPAFRKGHSVRPEDIPALLKLGKENLYVYTPQPGIVHEDEAAVRLARAAGGANLALGDPKEGKINFTAVRQGLLRIDAGLLACINRLGRIAFATKHDLREVQKGEAVAGVRVIPLVVEEELIAAAEQLCTAAPGPVVSVVPFQPFRIGMIITGSEIFHGRIKDGFGPVVHDKFAALGSSIIGKRMTSDDVELATTAIHSFVAEGADMVVLTGGMSVDPDDRTPAAIRASGARIISYGAPVFPGAMFMLAYLDSGNRTVPVLGLPGCVMYHRASIFDLVVPQLLAGMRVDAEYLLGLGHGGFCANCSDCHYPCCPFGL